MYDTHCVFECKVYQANYSVALTGLVCGRAESVEDNHSQSFVIAVEKRKGEWGLLSPGAFTVTFTSFGSKVN